MLRGVVYVEEEMVKRHGGISEWRVYAELRRRHSQAREEIEGLKWWHRAKSAEERATVREIYGLALDRYYRRRPVDNYPLTPAIY